MKHYHVTKLLKLINPDISQPLVLLCAKGELFKGSAQAFLKVLFIVFQGDSSRLPHPHSLPAGPASSLSLSLSVSVTRGCVKNSTADTRNLPRHHLIHLVTTIKPQTRIMNWFRLKVRLSYRTIANLYPRPYNRHNIERLWISINIQPIDSLTALNTDWENNIYANFLNEAPLQDHECSMNVYRVDILLTSWCHVIWEQSSKEKEQSVIIKMKISLVLFELLYRLPRIKGGVLSWIISTLEDQVQEP